MNRLIWMVKSELIGLFIKTIFINYNCLKLTNSPLQEASGRISLLASAAEVHMSWKWTRTAPSGCLAVFRAF